MLVHRDREEELIEALQSCVTEFYGDDPKASPDFARIVNERHHRRVARLIKDGTPAVGGECDEADCYVAPTVLRGVSAESAVIAEARLGMHQQSICYSLKAVVVIENLVSGKAGRFFCCRDL